MKRVVCALASDRNGSNSKVLAERIVETARAQGAETEVFALNALSFSGCQGCRRCKTGESRCVRNDGLTPVLNAIEMADVVVMATPVYFGQAAGQLKCLMDRMFSFLTPTFLTGKDVTRLAPGKKLVFIATQGNPDPKAFDVFATYEWGFGPNALGFEPHSVRGLGLRDPGDAAKDAALMTRIDELARQVLA